MTLSRLLLALALVTSGGCTAKDDDASKSAEVEAAAAPGGVETIQIPARKPPTVTLIEPGDEPRMPMRMHPSVGQRESLELSIGMTMSMRNGAQNMPNIPVPTTKTRMSAEVETVESGTFTVRHVVDDVEVVAGENTPKAVLDKVEQNIAPLRNYRAKTQMDERGTVLGGEVELPRDLPAMMHQTMRQMTESMSQLAVPLPAETVGTGARWDTVHEVEQNGMKLRQTGHYSIVGRTGDQVTLVVSMEQELLDPNVDVPGMLGATARVGKFESAGKGTVQLDLAHITPTAMQLNVDLSMTMDVSVLGQDQHVEMDMGIDMQLARTADE